MTYSRVTVSAASSLTLKDIGKIVTAPLGSNTVGGRLMKLETISPRSIDITVDHYPDPVRLEAHDKVAILDREGKDPIRLERDLAAANAEITRLREAARPPTPEELTAILLADTETTISHMREHPWFPNRTEEESPR
jgi:hypothetical protein